MNQPTKISIKVPKFVKPNNKKTLLFDFGDYCNKQANQVGNKPEVCDSVPNIVHIIKARETGDNGLLLH